MLSDEERKAIEIVKGITEDDLLDYWEGPEEPYNAIQIVLNLIEKQSKEIEEMKKQIDLDNECEIALNSKVMDLENADKKWVDKIKAKIEELIKEGNYRTADNPNGRVHFRKEITDYQIEVLQSLLEKE